MASANSRCVRPSGFRNSSNSISPGWVGVWLLGTRTIFTSVIVDYFNLDRTPFPSIGNRSDTGR